MDWSQQSGGRVNPEWMSTPTKIKRVGRGFVAHGRPVELGEIVTVSRYDAEGLVKMGKAVFV